MPLFPVSRGSYSLSKGFNHLRSIFTSHAPVESGTTGEFRPLPPISEKIRSVSPHPEQTGSYRPKTPLPLQAAGISSLRELVASVATRRNDASGVSQPGAVGSSQDQRLHPANFRVDTGASLAKGDKSAMRTQTSVADCTQGTGKSEAAEAAITAMAPVSKLTTDFAPLTYPGLVLAQSRAYEKSLVAAAPPKERGTAAMIKKLRNPGIVKISSYSAVLGRKAEKHPCALGNSELSIYVSHPFEYPEIL